MHVAIVTPTFTPLPRGGERYAAALAGRLAALGHHVSVVTSAAAAESDLWLGAGDGEVAIEEREDGVCVWRCPIRPFAGGQAGLLRWRKAMVGLSLLPGDYTPVLARMARRIPPIEALDVVLDELPPVDVVHAFNVSWECAMVAADHFARANKLPLVLTPFAHLGARKGDRVARNSTMDHQLRMLRRADSVLVLTDNEKAGLIEYGVAVERIQSIGSGLDPLPAGVSGSSYAAPGRLPERFALFIGRLSRDKGAIDAAEATLALRRKGRDVRLLLIGAVQDDFAVYYNALEPADRDFIQPLGVVSEIDKHAILSRAQMLLLPSRSDSFGIVFLEAWAYGRPVIGARAGGIPAVIDDGDNGFLVEWGDATALAGRMRALLDDPALAARMGANGRDKVQREYVWEAVASRVDACYRAVVQ